MAMETAAHESEEDVRGGPPSILTSSPHRSGTQEHLHTSQRSPWLRAMLMGALDGLLSVAAVMLGVGGGTGDLNSMRLAGLAAWIAGALSMFLGE